MEIDEIISSGLLELYATGLASVEESAKVQQWAAQYPEVAAELKSIEESMESYATINAVSPDASVKEKIFKRIQPGAATEIALPQSSSGNVVSIGLYWKWVAAASILFLAGSLALNISLYHKNNSTAENIRQMEQRVALLEKQNKAVEQDMDVVHSKYAMAVPLNGLEAAPDAAAKIFWMKNTGEVYIDPSNLPDAPQGKQYQLWAIVDGKPVDAGMIDASDSANKSHIQKMKVFPKAEAFAVTLESETGLQSPKGPMYVMGKV